MGVISGYSKNEFVSADTIYSKIRREWKSFSSSNLIDDGEFPVYTAELLEFLGIGAMKEAEAVIEISDYKAKLPDDFVELYAAYRCTNTSSNTEVWRGQGQTIIRQDITCEVLGVKDNCTICCDDERLIQKITTQMFVKYCVVTNEFCNVRPLVLSPNVKPRCAEDCINLISTTDYEITMDDGYITANFNDDCIYLKYYAFPMDEHGYPMVPKDVRVQKAVEWYIKYQLLLNFWFSDDVANIQNKWGKAEQEYKMWLGEARHNNKLPSFSTLLNEARNKRSNNLLAFFSKQYSR